MAAVLLLGLAGVALSRSQPRRPQPSAQPALEPPVAAPSEAPARRRFPARRLSWLLAFAAFLFAGAAFSAGPEPALEQQKAQAARAAAPARPAVPAKRAEPVAVRRPIELRLFHVPTVVRRGAGQALPRPSADEQAVALERYLAALGGSALLAGLDSARRRLADAVLSDPRVQIYAGGRADIASGKIDPRVLALIEYLAESHGSVRVSSLVTGHRRFSRPRVVSAHVYGRAVDIAAVGGVPVAGNQQPGGAVEQAVREILALPDAVRPRQVISLLSLGGPSFPLEDHQDHIHVGY